MSKTIKTRIQHKHDLEVNWARADGFVPMQGELIIYDIEVDANGNTLTKVVDGKTVSLLPENRTVPYTYERFKIGDNIHTVSELPFAAERPTAELISCGTADPSSATTSQFYFKYSTN